MENFNDTKILATGDAAPFITSFIPCSKAGKILLTTYIECPTSGTGTISFEYKNPFFANNSGVPFYSVSVSGSGYQTPILLESPVFTIRANVSGSGNYWIAFSEQS